MSLAPEEKVSYAVAGPKADATFEAGAAGFTQKAFRGCGVFTSEPFEVSDDQDSVQMLTRNSQIGEFYVMMPPQTEPMGAAGDNSRFKNTCDLLIFCEESDKHVRISWEDAMKATMIDTADLAPGAPGANADMIQPQLAGGSPDINMAGGMTLNEWVKAAEEVKKFNNGETDWKKFIGAAGGKTLDCRIVLARPFIEHMMHSAILAVSGRATGATLFGPSDMQLSANTQVKT